ncbi:MAG: DUF4142 domain-containing protein [Pseudomonadota bacterium]|jgi:putative membrane protein
MKRTVLLAAVAAATLTAAACQRQEDVADVGQTEPVNAAQDAAGAAVGAMSAATVGQMSTDAFVSNATESNVYEIEAGKIAQQKAQSAEVKAFGQQMVTDHTAMLNEMRPIITQAGFTPPDELDERRKGMLDNLRAASAAEFDRVYLDQQEAAHEEALTLMRGYGENGDNAALKDAAAKAAPKIQAHLDRVNQLKAALPAQ